MNERMKNVMECMENWRMELDDTLPFSCTHCGGCCVHQEELLLNPLDLFRMAVYLGITVEQWLDRYGECYIGQPDADFADSSQGEGKAVSFAEKQ